MAYLVTTAFDEFFRAINLPGDHRSAANARRDWVLGRIGTKLDVLEAFPIGSIPRFTALSGHADVDVLVVLHYGKHVKDRKPSNVLLTVRNALASPGSSIRRNGQAVTLRFKSWPSVDVVPAVRISRGGTNIGYEIPEMHEEEWIFTTPAKHSGRMVAAAATYGPDFRRLVKMVKHWNLRQGQPFESYHLEILALRTPPATTEFSWSLLKFFEAARASLDGYIWSDESMVDAYMGWERRAKARTALASAHGHALSAWSATYQGDQHQTAIGLWRKVFGNTFPTYG